VYDNSMSRKLKTFFMVLAPFILIQCVNYLVLVYFLKLSLLLQKKKFKCYSKDITARNYDNIVKQVTDLRRTAQGRR